MEGNKSTRCLNYGFHLRKLLVLSFHSDLQDMVLLFLPSAELWLHPAARFKLTRSSEGEAPLRKRGLRRAALGRTKARRAGRRISTGPGRSGQGRGNAEALSEDVLPLLASTQRAGMLPKHFLPTREVTRQLCDSQILSPIFEALRVPVGLPDLGAIPK